MTRAHEDCFVILNLMIATRSIISEYHPIKHVKYKDLSGTKHSLGAIFSDTALSS